ncbi:MAG: hypothetical protein IKG11_06330 [Atopobiaceae bacterium]|nr:hypothetical protein [Atopobiaceae bacterium]
MRFWLARLVHATWGLPQTVLGAGVKAMAGQDCLSYTFRSALVTEWRLRRGLSLGPFIFVPRGCPRRLVVHEYGHTVQALILGPLYLPVIVLPSLTWAGVPALERARRRRGISYYTFYTEHWANVLAERVCHEPSMR